MLKALQDKGALETEFVACIDPFTGFYEKKDPVVTIDTVRKNILLFGFDPNRIFFFQTVSQDQNTLDSLKKYKINTVFIDGDHRYEGVKADWENFKNLVMGGGYIVFDDYVGEENGRPKGGNNPMWRATSWGQVSQLIDNSILPKINKLGFQFVKKTENGIALKKCEKQSVIKKIIGLSG